jgi:hypothetical protein
MVALFFGALGCQRALMYEPCQQDEDCDRVDELLCVDGSCTRACRVSGGLVVNGFRVDAGLPVGVCVRSGERCDRPDRYQYTIEPAVVGCCLITKPSSFAADEAVGTCTVRP